MKTSASLVKLIIFMVITSMLTFVLAATIGNFSFGSTTSYKAMFTDVTGVLPGNEVRIAGVKVGQIKKVELKGKLAQLTFTLDEGRKVDDAAMLRLRYRNLVGERYLAITAGPGDGAPLADGATIGTSHTVNALDLTVLFNGFKPLFQALDAKTINEVSTEIVDTLQGEGGTVQNLLARTASLTSTLADRDAVIGRVITNLNTVLTTVDQRDAELNSLIDQLQRLSKGFARDAPAIGQSLAGINSLTSQTAGLLQDVRPPLRTDIAQLATLAGNLDKGKGTIDGVLTRLPSKLDRIVGTATYGSFFNFYLCGIDGSVSEAGVAIPIPSLINNVQRCDAPTGAATTAASGS